MIAEAAGTCVCTKRLSLLERWLSISGEYSRAVAAQRSTRSRKQNEYFFVLRPKIARPRCKPLGDNSKFTG